MRITESEDDANKMQELIALLLCHGEVCVSACAFVCVRRRDTGWVT